MDTYDVAIVGGGPAGLAAAMNTQLRGLSTVVFEAEAFGGQLINLYPTKPVTNFPAQPELASGELARRLADQAAHFGAELAEYEAVEYVGREHGQFKLRTDKRELGAESLILALGLGRFTPRKLGLSNEGRFEGHGLTYRLPKIEEVSAKRVVIVGGGDSAVDTALSLERVAEVTLVHRGAALRACAYSQTCLIDSGLRLLTNAQVVGLGGAERLEHVIVSLKDESSLEIPADLLLVSIGQVPDLRGVQGWDLPLGDPRQPVNSAMETGIDGVFAVGDFAEYPGKVKQIATAVAEGSTAAAAAERFLMMGGLGRAA
ncbi:MAG TPA: NAD(P)/FAD-dependent oxidoreductase [Candidatus Limnocylindrales bacterium]